MVLRKPSDALKYYFENLNENVIFILDSDRSPKTKQGLLEELLLILTDGAKFDKSSVHVFALGKHTCHEYFKKYASNEKMFPIKDTQF